MKDYKEIIKNVIGSSYSEILIIDIIDDILYQYSVQGNNFNLEKSISYINYLNDCKNYLFETDIDKYVKALSFSNLEEGQTVDVSYKMKDITTDAYKPYNSIVSLYNDNGKKLIVVLTMPVVSENVKSNSIDSCLEVKLKKMIDSVSLAILKIHNIINNDSSSISKKEYIDSILASLTSEFPEFNESLNENALFFTNTGKSTILIVDDDMMTCSLIKKIFSKSYDIVVANNGQEAIDFLINNTDQALQTSNISCIFLDLIMPVLDGFSVLDYLNDNNYLKKIPVIIISGNYDKETRNRAYSYQIADMLEKPFNVQVVRHRIDTMIDLYKSSNSLNDILSEQYKDLRNIVNSLIVSYEIDNKKRMEQIKKYTRILALQVSVDFPEYNIGSNMIDKIAESAMYYSIGNYTLPKSLILKRGTYTEEEKNLIKTSTKNGANIIKCVLANSNTNIDSNYCFEIAKYYNERFDGQGYPDGLSSNSIPLPVQIASLAIEYNNLINSILPVDYQRIATVIVMESGHKFNPKIVESFKKVQSEFEYISKA